uniref:Uncharacterized protein n=1 Tax=Ganoderma boninense TaxID=34458 RepID=A0A5K1K1V8_9APHY|nr:Uncharacterized protein [Ganoderma boninense]
MFPIVTEHLIPPFDLYATSQSLTLYSSALWPCIVLLVLSTALMGLFTALALFAAFVLLRKGLRRPPVFILFVVVVVMYASAALHWATLLFNVIGYYDVAQAYAAQLKCQCTTDEAVPIVAISPGTPSCSLSGFGLPGAAHGLAVCAPTIILTLNVVLGDAIVWWRVWVIWPRSLVVRGACVILLAATLGSGIIDSMDSCPKAAFSALVVSNLTDIPAGSFYQSDLFGLATSILSLANNMVATILIGCKAW